MKIIFFGSSSYVLPIIEVLRKNFDLKLVITTEKNPTDAVPVFCQQKKIEFLSVSNLANQIINNKLSIINAKLAILADFGLIIPQSILNIFPMGIINVHPSLLPKYRGPTPVQTAILNGEKITGVSIIKLDEEIDHGPILAQEKEEILDTDTSEILYKRLFTKGANLLPKILTSYLNGSLIPTTQNHAKATLTKSLTRQSGYVEISDKEQEISRIKRKIRAYHPWPGMWIMLRIANRDVRIKFLPENKIQVEGKKPMNYKDFLNGYPAAKELLGGIMR